jgi:hypothetical protein
MTYGSIPDLAFDVPTFRPRQERPRRNIVSAVSVVMLVFALVGIAGLAWHNRHHKNALVRPAVLITHPGIQEVHLVALQDPDGDGALVGTDGDPADPDSADAADGPGAGTAKHEHQAKKHDNGAKNYKAAKDGQQKHPDEPDARLRRQGH